MTMRLSIAAMALAIATPVDAAPSTAPATFVYCSAASISPRGRGLIVTAIFRSRTDIEFIKSAFTNYLRTSYAPYGNGWVVPEHGVTCLDFIDQRKADAAQPGYLANSAAGPVDLRRPVSAWLITPIGGRVRKPAA